MANLTSRIIRKPSPSLLRQEFENYRGAWDDRSISYHSINPNEIRDLPKRPEFFPHIFVSQWKKAKSGVCYSYTEIIHTSNEVIREFEKYLREKAIDVKAVDFDRTPEESKHLFGIDSLVLVSSFIDRAEISLNYPNGDKDSVAYDEFAGVDGGDLCTLRMLNSEDLAVKLEELEMGTSFSVIIKRYDNEDLEDEQLVALEYRKGNFRVTSHHIVVRNK